jgi:hypothetical protein
MLIVPEVYFVGIAIALILGVMIGVVRLQDWAAKQINKNKVTMVVYKAGKEYRYSFSTIEEAAKDAIKRVGMGERVAYIQKGEEKIWDAFSASNKHSLWKLSGKK